MSSAGPSRLPYHLDQPSTASSNPLRRPNTDTWTHIQTTNSESETPGPYMPLPVPLLTPGSPYTKSPKLSHWCPRPLYLGPAWSPIPWGLTDPAHIAQVGPGTQARQPRPTGSPDPGGSWTQHQPHRWSWDLAQPILHLSWLLQVPVGAIL